jgi:Ser/Thr protein kinase RdoA (MazF antagonist)
MGIDGDEAVATLTERYALGADAVLSGPVARGEQGQVWRLTTTLGSWAVKEPFVSPSERDASADADFQDAVRAAGVPMPRVVRTTDGRVLAELGSVTVRVYEWVDLDPPAVDIDPGAVGRVVGSLHRVRVPASRRLVVDPWHTDPVGSDRWDELVRLLEAAGAPFAGALAGFRDEVVALEALLEPPRDLQICHCDLWADNILATPTGPICVIDWENCGPADPSQELGMVLFEFGRADAQRARALYEAYVDAGGTGRIERPGNFSMAIAQLGHIAEYDCERWLDPEASAADRERHAHRFAEFTTRPLTRAVIDDLLAAVAG